MARHRERSGAEYATSRGVNALDFPVMWVSRSVDIVNVLINGPPIDATKWCGLRRRAVRPLTYSEVELARALSRALIPTATCTVRSYLHRSVKSLQLRGPVFSRRPYAGNDFVGSDVRTTLNRALATAAKWLTSGSFFCTDASRFGFYRG